MKEIWYLLIHRNFISRHFKYNLKNVWISVDTTVVFFHNYQESGPLVLIPVISWCEPKFTVFKKITSEKEVLLLYFVSLPFRKPKWPPLWYFSSSVSYMILWCRLGEFIMPKLHEHTPWVNWAWCFCVWTVAFFILQIDIFIQLVVIFVLKGFYKRQTRFSNLSGNLSEPIL